MGVLELRNWRRRGRTIQVSELFPRFHTVGAEEESLSPLSKARPRWERNQRAAAKQTAKFVSMFGKVVWLSIVCVHPVADLLEDP